MPPATDASGPIAPWAHYLDIAPRQTTVTTPAGTRITQVSSGPGRAPTPTSENVRDFQNLDGNVGRLAALDSFTPDRIPSGAMLTLNNFANGTLPITAQMINGITDDATREYLRDAQAFINTVARRESGAVVNPTEWAAYRASYVPPPGATWQDYVSIRQARAQVLRGVRDSLEGHIPDDELRRLDTRLMAYGVNLAFGEADLPPGVQKHFIEGAHPGAGGRPRAAAPPPAAPASAPPSTSTAPPAAAPPAAALSPEDDALFKKYGVGGS
jgi:hypothetical protein